MTQVVLKISSYITVTTQQSRRNTQSDPVETSSTLSAHGEGVAGSHNEDSHLTPSETIQSDTNPIVHENGPDYVSEETRGRRAEPRTNITSSHQAHLLYPCTMHRESISSPYIACLRYALMDSYHNSALRFTDYKVSGFVCDLASPKPAPAGAYDRAFVYPRLRTMTYLDSCYTCIRYSRIPSNHRSASDHMIVCSQPSHIPSPRSLGSSDRHRVHLRAYLKKWRLLDSDAFRRQFQHLPREVSDLSIRF